MSLSLIYFDVNKCKFLCVQQSYTFTLKNGQKVKEDVDVSVKGNFVQYHVKKNDTEVWVIDDFDRVSNYCNQQEKDKCTSNVFYKPC